MPAFRTTTGGRSQLSPALHRILPPGLAPEHPGAAGQHLSRVPRAAGGSPSGEAAEERPRCVGLDPGTAPPLLPARRTGGTRPAGLAAAPREPGRARGRRGSGGAERGSERAGTRGHRWGRGRGAPAGEGLRARGCGAPAQRG